MSKQLLEAQVKAAREGNLIALEELIQLVQQRIYGIAMRMLGHPQDAQDATQEILLKVVTHLSAYRGESAFTTWTYRIAVNHLLTMRKWRNEQKALSFEEITEQLNTGLHLTEEQVGEAADQPLLVEEMKIHCTQGMLLCLDREQRITYILGEVFEVSGQEGAEILEISPELFRQRLARARKSLRAYMQGTCGLVNPENPCRCRRQVQAALKVGKMRAEHLPFAQHPVLVTTISHQEGRKELKALDQVAAVFRSHPNYAAPDTFVQAIKDLLKSQQFRLFNETQLIQ